MGQWGETKHENQWIAVWLSEHQSTSSRLGTFYPADHCPVLVGRSGLADVCLGHLRGFG